MIEVNVRAVAVVHRERKHADEQVALGDVKHMTGRLDHRATVPVQSVQTTEYCHLVGLVERPIGELEKRGAERLARGDELPSNCCLREWVGREVDLVGERPGAAAGAARSRPGGSWRPGRGSAPADAPGRRR